MPTAEAITEAKREGPPDLEELGSDSNSVISPSSSIATTEDGDNNKPFDRENAVAKVGDHAANANANEAVVTFSVEGLYTKYYTTEEQYESGEREFLCCRRRMRTRPMREDPPFGEDEGKVEGEECSSENEEENNESKTLKTSLVDTVSSSNKDSSSLADKVDENEESDYDDDDCSESSDESDYGLETAVFVPGAGLVGAEFWHEYDDEAKVVREDRAVLFQSIENYEHLREHESFRTCFEGIDYMENPTFGEQIIVKGCDGAMSMDDLAVGDVFEIEGGLSPLVVEITAPRKPCSYMNSKHGTVMGKKGIQYYSHHNILAGWFARVLVAGELLEGMKFTRRSHPNPKWTLRYTHTALYGEGTRLQSMMNAASWNRDRAELEELVALPQLGEYEWKQEGRRALLKLDGISWKTVRYDLIDPQTVDASNSSSFVSYMCVTEILQQITDALKYFGMSY